MWGYAQHEAPQQQQPCQQQQNAVIGNNDKRPMLLPCHRDTWQYLLWSVEPTCAAHSTDQILTPHIKRWENQWETQLSVGRNIWLLQAEDTFQLSKGPLKLNLNLHSANIKIPKPKTTNSSRYSYTIKFEVGYAHPNPDPFTTQWCERGDSLFHLVSETMTKQPKTWRKGKRWTSHEKGSQQLIKFVVSIPS